VQKLRELLEALPEDLQRQVFTHASWTEKRSDSYSRLAFLGDSVLGLAVTTFLYPRLEAERYGAGRLTKIRAQAVSGPSCRDVAERLEVPERLRDQAPEGVGQSAATLVETERVLASVIEAVIGAVYLHNGYEPTAEAVVEAFMPEIERALEHPVDFKSTLQERLARRGQTVVYEVTAELGPPHDRTFEVAAIVADAVVAKGSGRSKKHAEQEAAQAALEGLEDSADDLDGSDSVSDAASMLEGEG
jgi:ribonuclease-3